MLSIADTHNFNKIALDSGLEAKQIKLLNEIGCGEYLRLFYYCDGQVLGSVCRSIGSFISGEWESLTKEPNIADIDAIYAQMSVLKRRGIPSNYAQQVYDYILNRDYGVIISFFSYLSV